MIYRKEGAGVSSGNRAKPRSESKHAPASEGSSKADTIDALSQMEANVAGDPPKARQAEKPSASRGKTKTLPAAPVGLSPSTTGSLGEQLFVDDHLMEASRTRWQYGEWDELASIPPDVIERHPDRARLALMAAAARSHRGEIAETRALLRSAAQWGCDKRLIARVLSSMVHNSLGRMATALAEPADSSRHFSEALALVEPRSDPALLARTRQVREMARMGLLTDAARLAVEKLGNIPADDARPILSSAGDRPAPLAVAEAPQPPKAEVVKSGFVSTMVAGIVLPDVWALEGNARYSADAAAAITGQDKLIHLEVKSIPRSGLHYLLARLRERIGDGFRFCEWYQEPGCCRRMPCELACHMIGGKNGTGPILRVVKSHDFDLRDPLYPPNRQMRRLVLLRDLRFVLTSWWCLDLLSVHKAVLRQAGIDPVALFYRHDSAMVHAAFNLLDPVQIDDSEAAISKWLRRREHYVLGFAQKWQDQGRWGDGVVSAVIRYQDIDNVAHELLGTVLGNRDDLRPAKASLEPRRSPLDGPTERISAALHRNGAAFLSFADYLAANDTTGLFRWGQSDAD